MKLSLSLASLLVFLSSATAAEWPQYRGPEGDGTVSTSLPGETFPAGGPKTLWKVPTETGFSSFTVADGKALTLVTREIEGNPMEVCIALDAKSGEEIWSAPLWLGADYGHGGGNSGTPDNQGGDGPRSTPTIDGDRVYILDAHLRLYCLNLDNGEKIWSHNLEKEHSAENIKWMNAASPVILDDLVYVAGGGRSQALLAFDKLDGNVVWKAESDNITHATPTVAEIHGVRQVIFFTQEGLVSVTPDEGDVLWRYDFPFNVSTAASPVVWEDIVYCSAGYGVGAGAVRISKNGSDLKATEIWRTENDNINHWSTPVVKDGYLYGMFSFKEYGKGPLACVDIRTGKKMWEKGGYGPGNVILAGEHLLALSDKGELVIVDADSGSYSETARADLLDGKCWSTPALADGVVYIRSTVEGGAFTW